MHCSELTSAKGVQRLQALVDLNLSSNSLISMQGVEALYKLQHLDLSCNKIQKIGSLKML